MERFGGGSFGEVKSRSEVVVEVEVKCGVKRGLVDVKVRYEVVMGRSRSGVRRM